MCQLSLSGIPGALVYKAALESLNLDSLPLPALIDHTFKAKFMCSLHHGMLELERLFKAILPKPCS